MTQYEIVSNRLTQLRNKRTELGSQLNDIESSVTDQSSMDDVIIARNRQAKIRHSMNQITTLIELNEKILMVTNEHEYQLEN
jgi:flagellin-like hook-associated protein FlgL